MAGPQSLDQYRLRHHAINLRRFTRGELRAITGLSLATVHHFMTGLTSQPGLVIEHADTSKPGLVGRPARHYELTQAGLEHLVDLNLEMAVQLNEAAFQENPALRPKFDRKEGAAATPKGRTMAPAFASAFVPAFTRLTEAFQHVVQQCADATTMLIGGGRSVFFRVGNELRPLAADRVWTMEEVSSLTADLLTPWQKERLNARGTVACSYESPSDGAMVVRVFKENGGVGLEVRRPPARVFSIDELELPAEVNHFCTPTSGFVFVSGPVSSGRLTALAAITDRINADRCVRIVTIEEPTLFRYQNKKSIVSQRQVGVDTPDFSVGVREALREDVDVLVLTEMSDHHTVEMALNASKQALVLCRVDAPDVAEAVDTLVGSMPPDEQVRARTVLAEQLIGAISLSPSPRPHESREITIVEADARVRELIRDPERTALLRNPGDPATGNIRVAVSHPAQAKAQGA